MVGVSQVFNHLDVASFHKGVDFPTIGVDHQKGLDFFKDKCVIKSVWKVFRVPAS